MQNAVLDLFGSRRALLIHPDLLVSASARLRAALYTKRARLVRVSLVVARAACGVEGTGLEPVTS